MSSPAIYNSPMPVRRAGRGDSLADILERVLDKGVVIAGDIAVNLLDIELLTLKVRLLIASADTAQNMGIDWWTSDPFLSSRARDAEHYGGGEVRQVVELQRQMLERLEHLERALGATAQGGSR